VAFDNRSGKRPDGDGSIIQGGTAGKQTLTAALPVMRRAAAGASSSVEGGTAGKQTLTAALPVVRGVGPKAPGVVESSSGTTVSDPFARHLAPGTEGGRDVQRRPAGETTGDPDGDPGAIQAAAALGTSGPSGPLPHLDAIQRSFGRHAVSHVSAHTGPAATRGAAAMHAEAFASGDHVAFAGSPSLHTAAHEAAHVVQQRAGVQLSGGVGREGDRYEQHANAVADRVVAGQSSEALLDEMAGGSARVDASVQRSHESRSPGTPVQRAPEKDVDRGEGKSVDKDFAPVLLLVDTTAKDAYQIEHTTITVYYKSPKYYRDDKHKKEFDVEAYRKTSLEGFGDWARSFQEISGTTEGLDEGQLKQALSMHLLQMFTCNALYEAEEISRFNFETTPLTFNRGGGYLRSKASSFVNALKSSFKLYSPEELFALRNQDFQDVLGQMMNRVVLDSSDGKEQIKAKLESTIKRMAKYAVDSGGLKKYDSDNPVTFIDFSGKLKSLEAEAKSEQIPEEAKKFGTLINESAFELAKDELIDQYVDQTYKDELEKAAFKREIKAFLANSTAELPKFYEFLNRKGKTAFDQKKDDDKNTIEGTQNNLDTQGPQGEPAQYAMFKDELNPYIVWLKADVKRHPGDSDEDKLVAAKGNEFPLKKRLFCELTRKKIGSFKQYLDDKLLTNQTSDYQAKDTFSEKDVGSELGPLTELIKGFEKGMPQVVMTGGILTLDKQPVLFAPGISPEMVKQIEYVLNKSGYNPTPTKALKSMLGKGMSVKDIAISTLQQQIAFEDGHLEVTDKLNRLLEQIHGFDPSKYERVEGAKVDLEQTQVLFASFQELAKSETTHLSLLASSTAKLVNELKLLDKDFLPDLMLERLAGSLQGALDSQNDILRFTREIQKIHELILFALELDPERGKSDELDLGISQENLQGARITDYGLKAFAEAYNAFLAQSSDKDTLKIDAYYNIYFELTHKLNTTRVSSGGKVTTSDPKTVEGTDYVKEHDEQEKQKKRLDDIEVSKGLEVKVPRPDLVLIDIHPNDAARSEMHKNDVLHLMAALFPEGQNNRCTVMVDVTLNYLSEPEVEEIRSKNAEHITSGRLNLVFVQSLTKFAQFGTDKVSGGLIVHYNNPEVWKKFNDSMKKSQQEDVVDSSIERYFQALLKHTKDEQITYLKKIRSNTTLLYQGLRQELARLDISEHAISVAINDDPGSCYVALHYEEFAAKLFGVDITDSKVESLNHDVLHEGIYKLIEKLNLPLSMRQSFGFPISNLGDTGKTLRLTLGIETKELLDQYIKIIAFVNGKVAGAKLEDMKDEKKREDFFKQLTDPITTIEELQEKLEPMFKKD